MNDILGTYLKRSMRSTFLKQIIYGLFYIGILGGIGYAGYRFVVTNSGSCFDERLNQNETGIDCGGVCESCEIKTLTPIQTNNQFLIKDQGQSFSFVVSLRNQNLSYAALPLPFTVELFNDSNVLVGKREGSVAVYAGEIKTIVVPAIPATSAVRSVFTLGTPTWVPELGAQKPNIQTRNTRLEKEDNTIVINGFVSNLGSLAVNSVTLFSILKDSNNIPIAASQTSLTDLAPSEERDFRISFPGAMYEGVTFDIHIDSAF